MRSFDSNILLDISLFPFWNFIYIKKTFKDPFVPYIKLTVDTYFYVSESVALTVGVYTSYNFGMEYETDKLNAESSTTAYPLKLKKYGYSSFDIGIALGTYFGRPNPIPKK